MNIAALPRSVLLILFAVAASAATSDREPIETVAVIGTGMVGSAIGPRMARLGFTVIYGSRDPDRERIHRLVKQTGGGSAGMPSVDAMRLADIIMLAIPWEAVEPLIRNSSNLSGKLIIDITNPMALGEDGYYYHPLDTAGAMLIAEWSRGARVVKAFNTVSSFALADPAAADGLVTVPVAADDHDAKCRVMSIARQLGYETSDAGPLRHAKVLEDMTIVYMVAFSHGTIATESSEMYLRKNDNYKNLISEMDEAGRPAWARGESSVASYRPCSN
jgi:predicted dinucleotide-binding enzyme